jgi:hypothetical protein
MITIVLAVSLLCLVSVHAKRETRTLPLAIGLTVPLVGPLVKSRVEVAAGVIKATDKLGRDIMARLSKANSSPNPKLPSKLPTLVAQNSPSPFEPLPGQPGPVITYGGGKRG